MSVNGSPLFAPLMANVSFPGFVRISSLILSRFSNGALTSFIPFWFGFCIFVSIAFTAPVAVCSFSSVTVLVVSSFAKLADEVLDIRFGDYVDYGGIKGRVERRPDGVVVVTPLGFFIKKSIQVS